MAKDKLWLKPEHFDTLHLASLANGGIGGGKYFVAIGVGPNEDVADVVSQDRPEIFTKRDAANPKVGPHCAVGLIRWAGDGVLNIEEENDDAVGDADDDKISFEEWVKWTNADIHPKAQLDGTLPEEYDQTTGEKIPEQWMS